MKRKMSHPSSAVAKRRPPQKIQAQVARAVASSLGARMLYFDTFASTSAAGANSDWTGTEIACQNYIQTDGATIGSYTDAALIPSAIAAGYGAIASGSGYLLHKIRIRMLVSTGTLADQADVPVSNLIRAVLVLDTQPNGSQIQGESIFTDGGSAGACAQSFLQMGAPLTGRVKILRDVRTVANVSSVGTDGTNTNTIGFEGKQIEMSYDFKKPLRVRISAASATPTIASLSDANVFLLVKTGFGATVQFAARAYYTLA